MIDIEAIYSVCSEKNFPLAIYRLPGEPLTQCIAQTTPYSKFIDEDEITNLKGFLFAPFSKDDGLPAIVIQPDFFTGDPTSSLSFEELQNFPGIKPLSNSNYTFYEASENEYKQNVDKIKQRIRRKEFQKAILSRIISKPNNGTTNLAEVFRNLCKNYPYSFVSLVLIPGIGCWVGASPELLLERKGKSISLVSLAGTQAKPVDNSQVVWSEKERTEQQIVTNYISDLLKEFHIQSFETYGPETIVAGNVVHLKTTFSLAEQQLNGHACEFINRLHPTPAVWGQPKTDALKIIKKLEKHKREYYSGYLGPVNLDGQIHLYVNLRTMKVLPDKYLLYVGCGITADSDPDKEWDESCMKVDTLLKVL